VAQRPARIEGSDIRWRRFSNTAQLRAIEQCFDIPRLDMTVPMKVREDTSGVLGLREIHDEDAASG
jgi:hypothetical protein